MSENVLAESSCPGSVFLVEFPNLRAFSGPHVLEADARAAEEGLGCHFGRESRNLQPHARGRNSNV